MARPRLEPGSWGSIRHYDLPNGKVRVRGLYRKLDGEVKDATATADTVAATTFLLMSRVVEGKRFGLRLTSDSTLDDLRVWWLLGVHAEARVLAKTMKNYQADAQRAVDAVGRRLRIRDVSPLLVHSAMHDLYAQSTASGARARKALRSMFEDARIVGVVASNPVDPVRAPRTARSSPYALSPEQARYLRKAFGQWQRSRNKPGPQPDPRVAIMIDLMLGLGIRIGEVLALRPCAFDLDSVPPRVTISATLIEGGRGEPIWRNRLKAERQTRDLTLPRFAIDSLQPLLADPASTTPLFPNRKGEWLRPGTVRRILHSFRDEWSDDLAAHGIEGERVSPQLFRRTVATMIATERGVDRAKEQLGHSSVQTTERHYVAPPRLVGTTTVALLNDLFG